MPVIPALVAAEPLIQREERNIDGFGAVFAVSNFSHDSDLRPPADDCTQDCNSRNRGYLE